MLPGTCSSSRIQLAKTGAVIFECRLKQQKTNPVSGRPACAREGVVPIGRCVSVGKKLKGSVTMFSEKLAGSGATTRSAMT
jgi:hypothetical protein